MMAVENFMVDEGSKPRFQVGEAEEKVGDSLSYLIPLILVNEDGAKRPFSLVCMRLDL